jgi:hypothetical protein
MTTTYERETLQWNVNDLDALAAVGLAEYFDCDVWVVHRPDGTSIAVRPTQVYEAEEDFNAEWDDHDDPTGYWESLAESKADAIIH